MRLINADDMRQDWLENGENEYVYDTNAVLDSIDAQPTVDAVEVVHGRWVDCSNGWMCSVCERDNTYDKPYCPNCGARMDGDAT